MNVYHLVHESTKESLKYNFDDKLYAIRRNLMLASTIVIAASFISPPDSGVFEVNIGLVKGVLKNPEYLYYFLVISCLYYLVWFYIHCRYVAVHNYSDIKHKFFYHLAAFRAKEAYENIYDKEKRNLPQPPNFDPRGGGGPTSEWSSQVKFSDKGKHEYREGLEALERVGFTISDYKGEVIVRYSYTPTFEDFQYLNIHLDLFWRSKWSQLFTTVLPIAYSVAALLLLSFNIYDMAKS